MLLCEYLQDWVDCMHQSILTKRYDDGRSASAEASDLQ